MISRRFNKTQKKAKHNNWFISFVIITCIIIFCIDFALRPSINKATNYQAKVIATNLISDITFEILNKKQVEYNSIVHTTKNDKGQITAIETDVTFINKLKSELTSQITNSLNDLKTHPYSLSLGTIIGNDYLAGRGPKINLRIEPTGFLKTELISKFTSAGINQTQHQILLNMTVDLTTIVPLHNSIIAETIIVGDVPEYYTNIISDNKSLISDINDYNSKKIADSN